MALLNQKAFERKLQNMSSTQDSVQTVSLWMIHHKKQADDMVTVWLDQLKKASKADRRLTLFYLANDVLQNSRKKGKEFSNAFTKILRDAMVLLSEKTIKGNVERVIKIWEERKLFEKDYLEALRSKLASTDVPVISKKPKEKAVDKEKEVKPAKQKRLPPADFKPSKLIDALKALRNFEGELTLKESQLNSLRIDASDLESVRQLKDRTGGGKFCEEYELATAKLEEFSETLRREQQERKNIVKVLEDGEAFYDVSYGEVKVIVHAYKTFGNRLTSLKKKVDSKVNRLAQKEAEKAKTGPVSAPQASFLTSGLPEVAEGSAPSTPTQSQQGSNKSSEDDKATDPTVDNIEVADMDIEDDSDSEKSETSEEASVQDPKSSNDETPNSTTSSDSQPTQATTKEPESTPVISPVPSVAPAQPLTPNMGTAMPLQGNMLPNQPQIAPPRPLVRMVTHPFMGVQGVRFPGNAPQFRPGAPPIQPLPGMAQNQLLQPTGTLPVPGQITSQVQPFPQMPRPAGLLPNANAPLPGGVGTLQRLPLGSGFAPRQAPLPVAVATVPAPVQVITNSVPASEMAKDIASLEVGSPDSEASAPSPVGSPELHLAEGDETPETTPAPLGDVDVNDNTGFQTNKSFFENPVAQSVAKPYIPTPVSQSPSSSGSTPSTSEQLGGPDAALMKKDNGQKVSAVDILAQLLSRGRKLQQPNDTDANSTPITPPVPAPIDASTTPPQNTVQPQKPLLSLIDSLFPKLSDSIKTLKEKEKAVNSPTPQCNPPVVDVPTSLPARPLPRESQFQHPSSVDREQPVFQQTGLKSILKKGPKTNEDSLATGRNCQEFGPETGAYERNSMNHTDPTDVQLQGPVEGYPSSNLPEDRPLGRPVEMQQEPRDDAGPGPRHNHDLHQLEQQGGKVNVNDVTPTAALTSHLPRPGTQFQGPAIRGGSPRFPQERPFERPLDMSPRGLPPFGPRLPFHEASRPQFQQSRDPPVERREGPPDMPGRVPPEQSPHGHSPRGSFRDGPPRRPSDTVHQEHHYMEEAAPGNPPDKPLDNRHAPNPRNNEDSFVNGPPGVKRLPPDGPPIHRPDPRQSPREQVPRGDGPPPHRASYPGTVDNMHQRREFERWEDFRREPYMDHRREPWDFPRDHPGPPPPEWRGPPVSPRGDPKRVDFREDDPSMWTSFESPGRPSRTFEGYREGPPEFDRFHGYGPPGRRRHSEGDFESERMRFPLKRPGPPPVPFPGPLKRPYY